jgi:hypothetical protein
MSDWRPTLDARTPWSELPAIVDQLTDRALDDFRALLAADVAIDDAERAALVAKARPIIEARTREALETGWLRLQVERHGVM